MRLALIGCGLIGTSAVWAMKKAGVVDTVVAFNRHTESAEKAVEIGAADVVAKTMPEAVKAADAVIVAVPVLAMRSVFETIAPALKKGAFITDVGSVRASVVKDAREALGSAISGYCPVHPIAGGEKTGVGAAYPTLFENTNAIVTPLPETCPEAVSAWEKLWSATKAHIIRMTVEEHDSIFASVSHLPHVVSFALVDAILSMSEPERRLSLAGSGFRDTTRIAGSSPVMWRDICLSNRMALLESLTVYEKSLTALHAAIEKGDGKEIEAIFERCSQARKGL